MSDQAYLYKQYNNWQREKGIQLIKQAQITSNQQILDIGCGTGELTYLIAKEILPNGKLIAIDPDGSRLSIAKEEQPSDINNISWFEKRIEDLRKIKPCTIDIAFANYTMHWVEDKQAAISNIWNMLKPETIFIMNCIADFSEIIADIASQSNEYNLVFKNYQIMKKDRWISLLNENNFQIVETNSVNDFIFNNLDDFLIFWEATSQGKFKRETLSDKSYKCLLMKYPYEINVFGNETLNVCAKKIGEFK